jgi:RNA polymerase sigma-70 factor, ECF subfamily
LQPTALVHEAYLRLVKQREIGNYTRPQFIALAANMMRRILINHAVRRKRQKREGLITRVELENAAGVAEEGTLDLFMLDEALQALAKIDKRQERIFELRFFGGLSVEETAEVMEISPATVKNEWAFARAWLRRAMKGSN